MPSTTNYDETSVNSDQEVIENRGILRIIHSLNKAGNLDNIGPISGLMAMATKRGMDCEVKLMPYIESANDAKPVIDDPFVDATTSQPEELPWEQSDEDESEPKLTQADYSRKALELKQAALQKGNGSDPEPQAKELSESERPCLRKCYTTSQVARKLGIPRSYLYRENWRDSLGAFQVGPEGSTKGCKLFWPKLKIQEFLDGRWSLKEVKKN